MKFSVTKRQPPVYTWVYGKDLLVNVQGNNLSIKIVCTKGKFRTLISHEYSTIVCSDREIAKTLFCFSYLHCSVTVSHPRQ